MGCFHVCDRKSDDEDSWLLLLMCQSCEIAKKDKFMYPSAFRAASLFLRRQVADGGSQTKQKLEATVESNRKK